MKHTVQDAVQDIVNYIKQGVAQYTVSEEIIYGYGEYSEAQKELAYKDYEHSLELIDKAMAFTKMIKENHNYNSIDIKVVEDADAKGFFEMAVGADILDRHNLRHPANW